MIALSCNINNLWYIFINTIFDIINQLIYLYYYFSCIIIYYDFIMNKYIGILNF